LKIENNNMLFQRKHPCLISSALLDAIAEGGSKARQWGGGGIEATERV
jgi:hypothetical protein